MRALQIVRFGSLEGIELREVAEPALPPDSVRVAVEAAAVNPSDFGVAMGRFPQVSLPRTLGRDYAGRIVEGPEDLVGMEVWGSGGGELGMTRDGTHAQRLVLPARSVVRRPRNLAPAEAAAVGVPFVTAWSALVELGHFSAGQWALISGAAGAVGSAAAMLAKALGGRAIALVLSETDTSALQQIGVDAVLRSDADDVAARVRELTAGRGADVALNGVGAPLFPALVDSLATGGRMVVYSARAGADARLDLFGFYRRRLQFFGLDTAALDLEAVARLYEKFSPFFESGAVKPPAIAATLPLMRAREAYERLEAGLSGKVVLVP